MKITYAQFFWIKYGQLFLKVYVNTNLNIFVYELDLKL